MTKINKSQLLLTNIKGVVASGYEPTNVDGDSHDIDPALSIAKWMAHSLSFFITAPIGGTIKTVIDILSRNELADNQITGILNRISKLNKDEIVLKLRFETRTWPQKIVIYGA